MCSFNDYVFYVYVFYVYLVYVYVAYIFILDVVEMVKMENGDVNPAEGNNYSKKDLKQTLSITAAFCEWFLTLLIVAYMLTFVPDFQVLELGKLNLGFYDGRNDNNCNEDGVLTQNINSKKVQCELPKQQYRRNIIKNNTKPNVKSYLSTNFQTWSTRKHKNNGDMQVVKCSSYRDVLGPHDMSLTLSTSSSYMSDSRTTNASLQCDNPEHQQFRHPLLDDSEIERGSNCGSEFPNNSIESDYKLCDISRSRQHTPIIHEHTNDTDMISICCDNSI